MHTHTYIHIYSVWVAEGLYREDEPDTQAQGQVQVQTLTQKYILPIMVYFPGMTTTYTDMTTTARASGASERHARGFKI